MIRVLLLIALVFGAPVAAQETSIGKGAKLRGLDKITGEVSDFELNNGDVVRMGKILIALGECRYPKNNPSGEAYAFLAVGEDASDEPIFTGWMIASSPALNAMEHLRYDVWVLRCITE